MTDGTTALAYTTIGSTHPWARFCAKLLDMWAWGFILDVLYISVAPTMYGNRFVFYVAWMVTFPVVEGLLIGVTGTSFGKSIFRASVTMQDASRMPLAVSMRRSYIAWIHGACFGVPLLNLLAFGDSHKRLKSDGITRWDREVGAAYRIAKPHPASWVAFALLAFAQAYLNYLGNQQV